MYKQFEPCLGCPMKGDCPASTPTDDYVGKFLADYVIKSNDQDLVGLEWELIQHDAEVFTAWKEGALTEQAFLSCHKGTKYYLLLFTHELQLRLNEKKELSEAALSLLSKMSTSLLVGLGQLSREEMLMMAPVELANLKEVYETLSEKIAEYPETQKALQELI